LRNDPGAAGEQTDAQIQSGFVQNLCKVSPTRELMLKDET